MKLRYYSALDIKGREHLGIELIGCDVLVFFTNSVAAPDNILSVVKSSTVGDPFFFKSDIRNMVAVEDDNGFLIDLLYRRDQIADKQVGRVKLICKIGEGVLVCIFGKLCGLNYLLV